MYRFLCILAFSLVFSCAGGEPWQYPPSGFATMTHYTLPVNFIASCGCAATSTHYPTAALSQLAFGSAAAYGPACGACFNLTLLNTFLSNPPFLPPKPKSIIVKVTDLCPAISIWCRATSSRPNNAGHYLNFDLAFPSAAIPSDFFPSNQSLYGYTDFGVWNISYEAVPCKKGWAGASEASALGSAPNMGDSVCCPADPLTNQNTTCPSFSLQHPSRKPNVATAGIAMHNYTVLSIVIFTAFYLASPVGNLLF